MNNGYWLTKTFRTICLILTLGVSMNADAGILGFSGTTWKEEVLLHDGAKIIVTRTVKRGGRHEIGQKSSYQEQSLSFSMPVTGQRVTWEDHYSEDVGSANFLPMLIDIYSDSPYLVVSPMGCLSYNKWGRPNPPYVIFKYQDKAWIRIQLQDLPAEIKTPNLIFSAPDIEVEKIGNNFVSVEITQKINSGYRQPEYRSILREPLPSSQLCPPEQAGFKAPYPPKRGELNGK